MIIKKSNSLGEDDDSSVSLGGGIGGSSIMLKPIGGISQ
jgi:hypothetical protein